MPEFTISGIEASMQVTSPLLVNYHLDLGFDIFRLEPAGLDRVLFRQSLPILNSPTWPAWKQDLT